jgi:hypothetical protein
VSADLEISHTRPSLAPLEHGRLDQLKSQNFSEGSIEFWLRARIVRGRLDQRKNE